MFCATRAICAAISSIDDDMASVAPTWSSTVPEIRSDVAAISSAAEATCVVVSFTSPTSWRSLDDIVFRDSSSRPSSSSPVDASRPVRSPPATDSANRTARFSGPAMREAIHAATAIPTATARTVSTTVRSCIRATASCMRACRSSAMSCARWSRRRSTSLARAPSPPLSAARTFCGSCMLPTVRRASMAGSATSCVHTSATVTAVSSRASCVESRMSERASCACCRSRSPAAVYCSSAPGCPVMMKSRSAVSRSATAAFMSAVAVCTFSTRSSCVRSPSSAAPWTKTTTPMSAANRTTMP